jgi:CRISPR-associated protein Csm1
MNRLCYSLSLTVQIFLQGKLQGIEQFLAASFPDGDGKGWRSLAGRSRWVSLLAEVLPRALLAELGLAPVLLGSSGGGQFLLVLPLEFQSRAEEFLANAAQAIHVMSGGAIELVWAATENLGAWSLVRKRLQDAMTVKAGTPAAAQSSDFFAPFDSGSLASAVPEEAESYWTSALLEPLTQADSVSWNPEDPARILPGPAGKHSWSLNDTMPLARHLADPPAGTWGVLRGDADQFAMRLRRIDTVEEHIQLSLTYKQFFAGELHVVLASVPDLAEHVSILYSGGDDFAVFGSWDKLIILAREIQRVFALLVENTLHELPGPEGKTITMALAAGARPLADLYAEAGEKLEIAKTGAKDSFFLFGRSLEWKQLEDAESLKDLMTKLVRDFDCSPEFLRELRSFYREGTGAATRRRATRFDRPWRFHRRLSRVLEPTVRSRRREREFEKTTQAVLAEFIGKQAGQTRLRPTGRVALEWAQRELE